MPMQFIDLSIPITNDVVSDPPVMRPNITYMTHEKYVGADRDVLSGADERGSA